MIARCHLPALKAANDAPCTREAFQKILAAIPEECPRTDCSPGAGCRRECLPLLRHAFYTRNNPPGAAP